MHENFPQVASVCLDNNGITSLAAFRNLPSLCPAVQNLSIAYNQIGAVSDLKGIAGVGLRELRLSGNPVVTSCTDKLKYHQDVKAIFPTLQNLDGRQLSHANPHITSALHSERRIIPFTFFLCLTAPRQFCSLDLASMLSQHFPSSPQRNFKSFCHISPCLCLCSSALFTSRNAQACSI